MIIIIKTIFIYLLAIIIVATNDIYILFPLVLLLKPLMRYRKQIQLIILVVIEIVSVVIEIVSNFIAVFFIFLLCKLFSIKPDILMVVIPLILRINNDNNRIKRAKKGEATVKRVFESSDELENYDQKHDIRIEYSYLIGDVIGLLLGSIYFLS